jgi:hypothetical protein
VKEQFAMRLMQPSLLCASLMVTGACVAGPLDFYLGAGVGESTLKQDYYQIDSHVTAWKLVAGWRPLDAFGAEVEYADLGSKNVTYTSAAVSTWQVSTSAHATAVFALGYLPVPMPWLDLYVKAGAARVQDNTTYKLTFCPFCFPLPPPLIDDSSRTSVAWGAGLQFKMGLPAVRVEYERFAGSQGNDSLLTLALTANF